MHRRRSVHLLWGLLPSLAVAASIASPDNFDRARRIWHQSKDNAEYKTYAHDFKVFSDRYDIGQYSVCNRASLGPVTLLLVIVHGKDAPWAIVQEVFANVDDAEARCYRSKLLELQIQPPPFEPFVLRLDFENPRHPF